MLTEKTSRRIKCEGRVAGQSLYTDHRVPIRSKLLHANQSLSHANRVSGHGSLAAPGNGFRTPEPEGPKLPPSGPSSFQRLEADLFTPAKSRVFGERQEISFSAGLRGGPGRIRTSNQTVMSGRPGSTCVRSTGVARKSPGPTGANGGHTPCRASSLRVSGPVSR